MKKLTNTNSFSVLIPDGDGANALSVIRCLAQEKNIKVFVLSRDKNASLRFSRHVTKFIYSPYGDTDEEKISAIKDAIKKTKADILLPVDIKAIRLIAKHKLELSELISLPPLPEVSSFDIADDKWLLSLWLKENKIAHPDTKLFSPNDSLDNLISSTTFPIIVKPRNGFGGKGIKIFENAADLQNWYKEYDHEVDLIVQSYINGYDIDCSIICKEGEILAHTIQKSIKYSVDYPWPYGLEFIDHDEIFSIVKKLAEKFQWSGVVHIDLRYDQDEKRSKVIEMNPRFWASVTASIFAGVNFPFLSCLSSLNLELPTIEPENKIVVRTGPAVKITFNRLFKNKKDFYFDNTFLEFILKDPIPTIIEETIYYYELYKNKLSPN